METDRIAATGRWIATVGGLGDHLPAPGTFAGSLPAAALWWALVACVQSSTARLVVTASVVLVLAVIGTWAAGVEERRRGREDPRAVVIDEVVGQWLTFLIAVPVVDLATVGEQVFAVGAGFVLFRICDIVKPWPANRLERVKGGIGIMADDIAAAVYAGLALAVIAIWL